MQHLDKSDEEWRRYFFDSEYRKYIASHDMTKYERRLLRQWVLSGHSVYESPGSRYLSDGYPEPTFLETYREDKYLRECMKGMSQSDRITFLKWYTGTED